MEYTLKNSSDWAEYKNRLRPDGARIPGDLKEQIEKAESSNLPIAIETVPLMGWIRNWMGIENMTYLIYDEPDVFADMVDTLSNLSCWAIDQIIPKMKTRPDMGFGWEDICSKSGPFVSPSAFTRYVAPGYLKIRQKLEEYEVKILGVDSDGDVSALLKPWLDSGVNLLFPLEIGTWNADPMEVRKKYGRELRIVGGFNKLVLEKGKKEIDEEIERRVPLMKEGGYILMPDHLITPGVPLENYKYYLERVRRLKL
jgi:uroporphyrinogen decarboxylase